MTPEIITQTAFIAVLIAIVLILLVQWKPLKAPLASAWRTLKYASPYIVSAYALWHTSSYLMRPQVVQVAQSGKEQLVNLQGQAVSTSSSLSSMASSVPEWFYYVAIAFAVWLFTRNNNKPEPVQTPGKKGRK